MRPITLFPALLMLLATACKKDTPVATKTNAIESHIVNHNTPPTDTLTTFDSIVRSGHYHGVMTSYGNMSATSGQIIDDTVFTDQGVMALHKSGNVSFNHLRVDDLRINSSSYVIRDTSGAWRCMSMNLIRPTGSYGTNIPTVIMIKGDSILFNEMLIANCMGDMVINTFRGKIDR